MKHISFTIKMALMMGCCASAAYCQQSGSAAKVVIAKLSEFSSTHAAEKAYLQFDKPYYAAGDTIYFKAYVTNGEAHHLSDLSGVLHVDLVNTKNKIDQSIRLQLDSGLAWGDFALPDSLPQGNYRVRAYTQWMRNNGDGDFFNRLITVGSVKPKRIPESMAKQAVQANLKPDIQFFPESGNLVTGIRSKVAFKATDASGLGIDIKGTVIDNESKTVTTFASTHLGMGYFYLTPEMGKTYTAKVSYSGGREDLVSLPKPDASGITLSVNNDSIPKASVRVIAAKDYYRANRNKNYTLVICSGGLVFTVTCKLDSPEIKLDILKRKLHTGVATITLFSPENEPLSERLIYIQNYDQLSLNVSSDKNGYTKREKVSIKLNALNRKGDPAEGHFSASVINESLVPEGGNDEENILTYLLLTADLKGYIEKPGYYFADTCIAASNNLDVLMLTQGYRRFEWKQVLASAKQTLAYQPENGIEIAGQVRNLFNKPVRNGAVTLISSHKGPILTDKTDDNGMFRFPGLIFADTAHFVLSAVNANNKNSTKITWRGDNGDVPAMQKNANALVAQVPDTALATYVANAKMQQREDLTFNKGKGILLKQVNIHEKKPDDQYRTESLAGAGHADQAMHADEIAQVQGPISSSLNGRLRGVTFVGTSPTRKVPVLAPGSVPMLVIIDGAEVDPDDINSLTPNDIETVEVLKYASTSMYGMEGGNGVLVITTKTYRGVDPKDMVSIGVLPIAPMGFYKARVFYSPKYDNNSWVSKQKDLRSTLCWQPELKTDRNGNASFDFYNADETGTCKVILEGIDKDGNIGRQIYTFKVE